MILNSGHMVPIDQPVWASEIVQNFLQKAQITSPKVTPVKICPSTNDWIRIENSCFKVVNQSLTYTEAMKHCQAQESYLFEPKSSLLNSLVQHFARTSAGKSIVWIGINDKNGEGSPEYSSDHSSLEWSNWENWRDCVSGCQGETHIRRRKCPDPGMCWGQYEQTSTLFSEWTSWSSCSVTCSNGIRTRTRTCMHPDVCQDSQENKYCIRPCRKYST